MATTEPPKEKYKANQDQKEKVWLERSINYHNKWDGTEQWKTDVQVLLENRLKEKGIKQILVPVQLEPNALEVLYKQENVRIARLFVSLTDIYDELPYRPDVAFDLTWRTFEILMKHYCHNTNAIDCITKISNDFTGYDTKVTNCINRIIQSLSLGSLKFCINLFVAINNNTIPTDFNLMYNQDGNKIIARLKSALDKKDITNTITIYDKYIERFINNDYYNNVKAKDLSANQNINQAAQCLKKIENGDDFYIKITNDETKQEEITNFHALDFNKRLEFLLSTVLYTIRNNRFHGDNNSLFKSCVANLSTYYSMYHCLIATYSMFWLLLYKYLDDNGIEKFVNLDNIINAINESLDRLNYLPNK